MSDEIPKKKLSPKMSILMLASLGLLSGPMPDYRPKRKCRLPSCSNFTSHNGGYCCAEHHKEGKSL